MLKKKFIKLSIVFLLALSLFACNNTTNSSINETSIKTEETTISSKSTRLEKVIIPQNLKDLYNEKSLNIKTVKNVRQLGGFLTKDGKKVKNNLLIRGAHLSDISDEEAQILKNQYNVKEVIDFRTDYEKGKTPDKNIDGVNNTWLTVMTFSLDKDKIENITDEYEINKMIAYYKYNGGLDEMYSNFVDSEMAKEGFRKFFDILLKNDGATYWHCTNGKDRTGFAAVLLLSALNVDEKTILDDYEASIIAKEDEVNAFLFSLNKVNYDENDTLKIANLAGVDRNSMEKALRLIDSKYNGMDSYLHNQIGLTNEDIKTLKNKYLEEDFTTQTKNNDKDITIVFTNDIHCGINDNIGLSGVMTYYKNIDENTSYKALVDAGDFSQGGAEGSINKGELMYDLMNEIGYDFIVPGNHEFDYGIEKFLRNSIALTGIMYSCNFVDLRTNETLFDPYKIMTFGDKKVAFIGVCTPDTIRCTSLKFFQDDKENYIYSFCHEGSGEKLFDVIQKNIDSAKSEGADNIILVMHMGDESYLEPFSTSNIIKHLENVDAVIDGHTHKICNKTTKDKNGNDIIIAQAGTKMQGFGVITIKKDGTINADVRDHVLDIDIKKDDEKYNDTVNKKDKDTQKIIDEMEEKLNELLGDVIYKDNKVLLTIKNLDTKERAVRKQETNLGDFITDAFKYVGKSDVGVYNGGGIRNDIDIGDITYSDVLKVLPFSNMLCVVKMKGKDLLDYLEYASMDCPKESGAFAHVSGITYTIDTTKKSNAIIDDKKLFVKVDGDYRVRDVLINNEPIDLEKEYTVCGSNYTLINLGSGCTMFKNVEIIQDNFITDIESIEEYLDVVDMDKYKNPAGENRISIIIE